MAKDSKFSSRIFFLLILVGFVCCLLSVGITLIPASSSNTPHSSTSTQSDISTPTPHPSETSSPTDTATPTASATPTNTLNVIIQTDVISCDCGGNGNYGTVLVKIEFINGEPIFEISGQKPVRSRTAKFEIPLGTELYLVLESSDGLRWEGPVEIPSQCTVDTKACNQPPAKPTEKPPVTECNDGRDNDFDGKEDYPDDPGCSSSKDDSEWPFNWP